MSLNLILSPRYLKYIDEYLSCIGDNYRHTSESETFPPDVSENESQGLCG